MVGPFAAEAHDPLRGVQHGLGRGAAQIDQDFRFHELDMTLDERQAGGDLGRGRAPVSRRIAAAPEQLRASRGLKGGSTS